VRCQTFTGPNGVGFICGGRRPRKRRDKADWRTTLSPIELAARRKPRVEPEPDPAWVALAEMPEKPR
jgi:hypothetical protein